MTEGEADLVIRDFCDRKSDRESDNMFVRDLVQRGLTRVAIANVIEALVDTCFACFDDDSYCQCSNDD